MAGRPIPADVVVPIADLTLDERARRINAILEDTALRIGAELWAAKSEHPDEFHTWLVTQTPFSYDQALRLVAIYKAFANADDKVRAALPSAATALYAITKLPADRLRAAIDAGEIHPGVTGPEVRALAGDDWPSRPKRVMTPAVRTPIVAPILTVDLIARELLRLHPEDLDPVLFVAVEEWLGDEAFRESMRARAEEQVA